MAAVLAAYFPALEAPFVWDDHSLLASPALHAGLPGLSAIWTNPAAMVGEEHYWPVVYTAFWLQKQLWGGIGNPTGFHFTNIVLHGINCLLLVGVLACLDLPRLTRWAAAFLFAVHPVHVESVAWIIELKDVLSTFFYLLAALGILRAAAAGYRPRLLPVAAALCFVLAMWSKTIVATLPIALALVLWYRSGRLTRADLTVLAGLLVLAIGLGALDLAFATRAGSADFPLPLQHRLEVFGRAFWFYTCQIFWPVDLVPVYRRWEPSPTPLVPLVLAASVLLAGAVLWVLRHRTGRGPLTAFAFYLVTLSPLLGAVRFSFMQHSFVADRFQYLAVAGPLTLLAALWAKLAHRRRNGALLLLAVTLALLGALTWRQCLLWQNPVQLFERNAALNPYAWLPFQILGREYAMRGEWARAEDRYRRALELRPGDDVNARNLASVLLHLEKPEEALQLLEWLRVRQPENPRTLELIAAARAQIAVRPGKTASEPGQR